MQVRKLAAIYRLNGGCQGSGKKRSVFGIILKDDNYMPNHLPFCSSDLSRCHGLSIQACHHQAIKSV